MNAINNNWLETKTMTELVIKAQEGDKEAFGELYKRFQRMVLSISLKRLRNQDDAEELCQEVFMHAMTKLSQLREPVAFNNWLRQVTVRLSINQSVRRRSVASVEPEILESTLADFASPVDASMEADRRELIDQALERLNEIDRSTLTEFYLEGKSVKELAKSFGAPIGTIKRRLHTARKRLAAVIDEDLLS